MPLFAATPSTSGNLSEKLKGTLRSSEVRYVQTNITINYPHKCNSRKVVSFGDHLGSYQNIHLALSNATEYLNVVLHRGSCISVKNSDTSRRK
jgi:hypothetical protein